MKKEYKTPTVVITSLNNEDLITLSSTTSETLQTITNKNGRFITFSDLNS